MVSLGAKAGRKADRMKTILVSVLLLASLDISLSAQSKTEYVIPNSVECISTGLSFNLSRDAGTSDLADETGLNILLYTAEDKEVEFDLDSGSVQLNYGLYGIVATTVYTSGQRPILYNIDQPFFAVPKPGFGIGRNYTFTVGCMVPASFHVHILSNTTDEGHGDHGGGTVDPNKHIAAQVSGVRADGTVSLGNPLIYTLDLTDDVYAGLVPVNCRYFDPSNEAQQMDFVKNNCPVDFPDDEDSYLGTMKRNGPGSYELHFKAFTFDSNPNSFLGLTCDIQICVRADLADCYKPCWGPEASSMAPESSSGAPETSEVPSSSSEASVEPSSEEPQSSSEEPSSAASEAPSTSEAPVPPRRKRAVKSAGKDVDEEPVTTTIKQKSLLKVNMPGTGVPCDSQPVCSDSDTLVALYAIIGALAVLILVLVFTVVFLLCVGRKSNKIQQYPAVIANGY